MERSFSCPIPPPEMPPAAPPLSILQILEKGLFSTGSVVQMFQLARGLSRRGHRVAIVTRDAGEVPGKARAEGLDFHALPLKHEFDFASARKLAALVDEREVDVIHVHKGIAHSIALFSTLFSRRRPVLVVNRGVSFPLDVFNRIKFHVRMDAVVTVCEDIKRVIVKSGRLAPGIVHVIYAGVDLSVFDPGKTDGARVRREWGVSPGDTLLVQVGAREWKGWRDLVSATALLAPEFPRLRTAIVACEDEAKKADVLAFARAQGVEDRVRPIGFRSDMPDVLAAADMVADLSYEGLGVTGTLREAMALGKPVLGSAAGGNPELVVDGESGLLVPPRDPPAMAAAVRRLLADPALAASLGRSARARVEAGFSSEVRLDRVEALYRRLISERARGRERTAATAAGR
ncbi:MAG: glycosyltransferase family 4 protein [Acidobacteria bacterium]|nr:glycosyltransferase family 4 protein [Acidobacteriota bacterium]MCA1611566.1 glycosyltransferase family 4 protein [Acidobacteriota bacterium]